MDDAIRQAVLSKLPAAGIAIPFVLALLAHLAGPKPGPVAAAPPPPALAFHQFLVDLNRVAASENVMAHFDFTNRGSKEVEITDLIASCGCLQPYLKKKVYKPGETGFFTLKIETANQAVGQKEYTVAVKYTDPQPQEALVSLRFVLPDDQVLVRPIALFFYQLGDEQLEEAQSEDDSAAVASSRRIKPQVFEIIDRRGRHLNIARVESSNGAIKVDLQDDEVDDAGTWHGRFRVCIEDGLPPGRREAVVRIFTDDPDDRYRVLRVPLYMQGPSRRRKIDRHVRPAGAIQPAEGAN